MATRKPGGPFVATCPTRELLEQLADKWSVLLLLALSDGPVRFNALKRKVEGITQKMLGQTLRRLERNGLVERRVFATVPVTVEYEVTPLGRSLSTASSTPSGTGPSTTLASSKRPASALIPPTEPSAGLQLQEPGLLLQATAR